MAFFRYANAGGTNANLANVLGVMASLLQEIISVYPLLNPSQLTAAASNRVCNALALLQCVASHTDTRGLFLSGNSHFEKAAATGTNILQHTSRCFSTPSSTQRQNHVRLSICALHPLVSSARSSRTILQRLSISC